MQVQIEATLLRQFDFCDICPSDTVIPLAFWANIMTHRCGLRMKTSASTHMKASEAQPEVSHR